MVLISVHGWTKNQNIQSDNYSYPMHGSLTRLALSGRCQKSSGMWNVAENAERHNQFCHKTNQIKNMPCI